MWVSRALRHSLNSLEVNCRNRCVFPSSLVNRTSLRKLKLHSYNGILKIAAKNCAPNLTSLNLCRIKIVNEDPTTSSVTFPLLETLHTSHCKWLNVKSVELYAPSLTTFWSSGPNLEKEYDYSFVIHAPRLAKFIADGRIPEKFDVIYGSLVVSAEFYADYDKDNLELRTNIASRFGKMFNEFINILVFLVTIPEVIPLRGTPLRPHDKLRRLEWCNSNDGDVEQLLAVTV